MSTLVNGQCKSTVKGSIGSDRLSGSARLNGSAQWLSSVAHQAARQDPLVGGAYGGLKGPKIPNFNFLTSSRAGNDRDKNDTSGLGTMQGTRWTTIHDKKFEWFCSPIYNEHDGSFGSTNGGRTVERSELKGGSTGREMRKRNLETDFSFLDSFDLELVLVRVAHFKSSLKSHVSQR
ncbi:hypothetical protein F3Y22_tig00113279pilonHSYRG00041 [Hibiscus syriacus]|uniref:Uncharacterized protein n=1 Tax=Hibiscus syriacus TaxID=106335 RepID=A0A6A2WR30_HIBSY|nr:hypothetical protein F3Y22_tig00113279pilonHSYRG00041 [Hibiscus syriacus]